MIELEQALDILKKATCTKTTFIQKDILQANGMVTSEDIIAPIAVPHFPKSGMDGYAVRSEDIKTASKQKPVILSVIDEVCAGDISHVIAKPQTAVRIMTGAKIPNGYDCVVKQEDTDYGVKTVAIFISLPAFKNYCPIGEDIPKGSCVIPKRTLLTPTKIGLLASLGIAKVNVIEPVCVGIISTGNELVKLQNPVGEVGVYPSSAYTLATFLDKPTTYVKFITICGDTPEQFIELVRNQINSVDILLTTGALSVGKKDFLPSALKKMGANILFKTVRIRPGTPVMASQYKNKIILSISGYPFAAFVNFQIFFWPILAKILDTSTISWKKAITHIKQGSIQKANIRRFLSAHLNENGVYIPDKKNQSSILSSALDTNCLIDVPADHNFKIGDEIEVIIT